jgi:co-chaperonin GroES (HSP10)
MAKKMVEPAGDHVIVIDVPRETTIDGISLPENEKQQEMLFGRVVFAGFLALNTAPEDLVMYGPYAGKFAIIDGVQFRIMKEGQIEAYLR